jgi:hypothetical protein
MLERYYSVSKATGVSVNLIADGIVSISACGVSVNNNRLDIEKKVTGINELEMLNKHFKPGTVIALGLFGKGILQKQIDKVDIIDQKNFSLILPNADAEDFYVQNFVSGDKSFVSVIRRADADKWINHLTKLGFSSVMLSLGPFAVFNILPQVNIYEGDLIFDGHVVKRNEQSEWTGYQYKPAELSPFPIKIASESIDEQILIPYALAFQVALEDRLSTINANVATLHNYLKEHINNRKLRVKGFVLLLAFFCLLLINFFVFSWLTTSNAKLADKVNLSARSSTEIQEVNDRIASKEALVKELGWDGGINKSLLIDDLAALLPAEVSWTDISVNPLEQSVTGGPRSLHFLDGRIRVVGNAERIIPVNEWIARVKTKRWVKNIQLESYAYNSELNTGQFTVKIDY